jgi:hypothetical protein
MTASDDGGDRLGSGIWADVGAGGIGRKTRDGDACGCHFPCWGVTSTTFSTGENSVHSWTNDGSAYVVTFLKALLWNLTRSRCLMAGCEAMVGSRSCSRDMLELGNGLLLRKIRSHILLVLEIRLILHVREP